MKGDDVDLCKKYLKMNYFKNIIEYPKYRNERMKLREGISRMRIKITIITGKSPSVQRGLWREVPHHFEFRLDRTLETPEYCRKKSCTHKEMIWII